MIGSQYKLLILNTFTQRCHAVCGLHHTLYPKNFSREIRIHMENYLNSIDNINLYNRIKIINNHDFEIIPWKEFAYLLFNKCNIWIKKPFKPGCLS